MKKFRTPILAFCLIVSIPAVAATDSPPLSPETILASSKNTRVTYADLMAELARIPAKDQFEFLMSRQRLSVVVENILINKTLAQEAREIGLDKKPEIQVEIQNQIDKVLAKYRGQEIQANAPRVNFEAKARELFVSNPDRFVRYAQIDTWHTLVSLSGRSKEQAMARAQEIRKKLIAGASKEEIALEYSDDQSRATNNGNLGMINKATLDRVFVTAAEKLKVGEFSEPVETVFGIHIIQLKGMVPESRLSYEITKRELLQEAEAQYSQAIWEQHINAIRNDTSIKINAEALDAVKPKMPELPPPPVVEMPAKK
jgi:peptidyl-prolyl cis-trans isomerase C